MNKLLSITLLSVVIFQSAYSVVVTSPAYTVDPLVIKNRAIIQRFITEGHHDFYLNRLPLDARYIVAEYYSGYSIGIRNAENQSSSTARSKTGCAIS